ncbi:hypothetical protein C6Y45_01855 [Alkalicoccus saliphilus]|uniref:AB hydrolase-1 domain-containing protein n=1 Tax=Alkalicoccus saliphilus TaxID=200989 RepID=A0A2T4U9S3_9BACI|nr:hypothetical protein C6Y45_01855 [Alkalicoccus saliphilus]
MIIPAVLWNKWIWLLSVPVLIIGVVILLIYLFQDRLIFYPQTITEEEADRVSQMYERAEEVMFTGGEGKELHGWLVHPRKKAEEEKLLIYYGGNAEELSGQISLMSENLADWTILLVNYRGYGMSEGTPDEEMMYEDALAVFDNVNGLMDHDPAKTVLMGRSIGTGIAVKVASERQVDGMVLITPFDSLKEVARYHYPFLPVSWLLRYSFDSASRINDTDAPLLIIAGGEDHIIPEERALRLLEEKEGTSDYEFIENRGHNDIHSSPRFWEAIKNFLIKR